MSLASEILMERLAHAVRLGSGVTLDSVETKELVRWLTVLNLEVSRRRHEKDTKDS